MQNLEQVDALSESTGAPTSAPSRQTGQHNNDNHSSNQEAAEDSSSSSSSSSQQTPLADLSSSDRERKLHANARMKDSHHKSRWLNDDQRTTTSTNSREKRPKDASRQLDEHLKANKHFAFETAGKSSKNSN